MDNMRALRQTRLFEAMPEAALAKLAALAKATRFRQGEEICREGASGSELFVLVLGSVRAIKGESDEDVATIGSGSYFGEMAMASSEHKRAATIRALEDSEVLVLSGDAINTLAEQDAPFGYAFYRALSRGLAQRMRAAANDVALLKSLARKN
jgi:CRP-like cAMP-binding protein